MVWKQRKRRDKRCFHRALRLESLEQRQLFDVNDSLVEAVALGAITTNPQTINANISPDTDVNIYRFNVTAGQVVDFDIDTPLNGPGGLGSFLRLFNAQGQELAFNNDAIAPGENVVGFDAYLRRTFPTAGTFYIGVSNANNTLYNPITGDGDVAGGANATGSYQLIVQALPVDPDDSLVEAIQIGTVTSTPFSRSDSINPDIDVDLYRFAVAAGQVVDFDIDTAANGPGGVGSFLRLFNAQGQEIAFNNNAAAPGESVVGFDAYLRFTFATAGTYYIGVSNGTNTLYNPTTGGNDTAGGQYSIGSYVLIVQTAPAIPADPDDTLTEANVLGAITTTPSVVNNSITPDTDVDLYRFTVTAGQTVDFDIDTALNGPGGLGSFLRLFSSTGQELAFNDNAAAPGENVVGFDAYLRFTFATGGTYYIGVSNGTNTLYNPTTGGNDTGGGQFSIGDYQLIVQTAPAAPADPDDTLIEANVLGAISTTPQSVSDSITPDTDVDLYRFNISAGQVVDFDIDTQLNGPGGLGSFLRLFNAQGQELAFNNDAIAPGENVVGFDAYLRFTFTTAGTFYIGVSNANNTLYNPTTGDGDVAGGANGTGTYQLIVQALPVDRDDSLVEAIQIGTVTSTPFSRSDSINPHIDVDLYRFAVSAGQVVDFDIDTALNGPGGLGSFLRLFSSTGQELAFNNNGVAPGENVLGFDAYLRFTFATAGTYYIGVSNATNTLYNPTTGGGDAAGGQFSIGDYQLIVQTAPVVPVDPDDSLTEAFFLGAILTTPSAVSDSITPDTDVDLYRFTVAAGQVVDFDIDTALNGSGGLGSFLRLFNAQGQELAFNDNAIAPGENVVGFDAYLRFTFTTGGTYYVGVSNANNTLYNATTGAGDVSGGANATGNYQLIVQALPVDPDDSLIEAAFLGAISTTPIVVNDSIFPDIDVDLYRFTVVAGQVVDFDIDTAFNGPGGLGSFLRLFNAQGQELAFNDNAAAPGESATGFDAYLRFTFATAGTYYIGVSNGTNTLYNPTTGDGDAAGGLYSIGDYQLIVETVPAVPVDPDDSLTEATSLGAISTTPTAVSATISPDVDVDLYRFTVTAGQVVDFDIDTSLNGPGGLGSFLRLFNAQGQELAFNNNGAAPGESLIGFDAYLRFTFAAAGTYYIGVSNSNNILYDPSTGAGDAAGGQHATGDYQLIVQAQPVGNPTLTLTTNLSSIPELNGTAIGTVARSNADISQPLVVTLGSSDTGAATVPTSVMLAANQAAANFTITAVHSTTRGTTQVTISAAATGYSGGTVSLLVTDSDASWRNPINPFDVDNDGSVSPIDAVLIINFLNAFGPGPVPIGNPPPYMDVDGDNFIAPIDAVLVINIMNSQGAPIAAAAGEDSAAPAQATPGSVSPVLLDSYFADLGSQLQSASKRRNRSHTSVGNSFAG